MVSGITWPPAPPPGGRRSRVRIRPGRRAPFGDDLDDLREKLTPLGS
jgi:hypothetical protein